jgi:hypothetical protein
MHKKSGGVGPPLITVFTNSQAFPMIDYAKIEISADAAAYLLTRNDLSFETYVNEDTAEQTHSRPRMAEYEGMEFYYYPSGRMTLHGSWHKYYCGGRNHSDFSLAQFQCALMQFCRTLKVGPDELKILQLEFGVNITPPILPQQVIDALVGNGKGNGFSEMRTTKGRSIGVNMYLTNYALKIYDKGAQYRLTYPVLRLEKKYINWCKYRSAFGIYTMADLFSPNAWDALSIDLMKTVGQLVIKEPSLEFDQMTIKEKFFITQAADAKWWKAIPPKKRLSAKKKIDRLVDKYGWGSLHNDILGCMTAKMHYLMHDDSESGMFSIEPAQSA